MLCYENNKKLKQENLNLKKKCSAVTKRFQRCENKLQNLLKKPIDPNSPEAIVNEYVKDKYVTNDVKKRLVSYFLNFSITVYFRDEMTKFFFFFLFVDSI